MNNKTSDNNVANIEDNVMSQQAFYELIDSFEVVSKLTMYGRKSIKHYVKKMQAELEQKDKRIQELEEEIVELKKYNRIVSDRVVEYKKNSIPKQTVIDKIKELKKQISIDICIENNLEKHYELKYKIEALQKLLEGEK